MRRRVWCETLPYEDIGALAPILVRYGVDLLLAVRPWQVDEVPALVERLRGVGIFVGVWPMLDDADGRWASVTSAVKFIELADRVLASAPDADEIVVDLEPPIAAMTRWKDGRPTWRTRGPGAATFDSARHALRTAIVRWRAQRRVTTAIMPMLAFEGRGNWMQRLLGTPATDLPVDRHSVMAYTSLFEGWSRGFVGRRRAELVLAGTARFVRARFGDRAALSLGTIGVGAFGDEPAYRDVTELARDVALAKTAGIDELSVFDLGGMVRRGPVEAWLDALA